MLKDALPRIISKELPGALTKEILKIREENTAGAIKPLYPLSIKAGQGAMVEDFEGNRYVDFVGGVGVLNIGLFASRSNRGCQTTGRQFLPFDVQHHHP